MEPQDAAGSARINGRNPVQPVPLAAVERIEEQIAAAGGEWQ